MTWLFRADVVGTLNHACLAPPTINAGKCWGSGWQHKGNKSPDYQHCKWVKGEKVTLCRNIFSRDCGWTWRDMPWLKCDSVITLLNDRNDVTWQKLNDCYLYTQCLTDLLNVINLNFTKRETPQFLNQIHLFVPFNLTDAERACYV